MKTSDHKRQIERQGERYKKAYLCTKQFRREADHQVGKVSIGGSTDNDIPGVVSKEIQQETQVVGEEDKEENCNQQPMERNRIGIHQMLHQQ